MHRGDQLHTYKYEKYQTMKLSFEQICQKQDPWIPLGNFMNHWYSYHVDERERLIADPLQEGYPQEYHRWAAFCAASVEWFCHTYGVPCPDWVHDPRYMLAEPWVFHENRREELLQSTPKEFASRNVYCGADVYANKWEFMADVWLRYGGRLRAMGKEPDEDLLPYIEAARQKRAHHIEKTTF